MVTNNVLTAQDLLLRGYFHDRIIPPLGTASLEPAMDDILDFAGKELARCAKEGYRKAPQRTRCVMHSVPKRKLARRFLAIPNPRNQAILCLEIEEAWPRLRKICELSPISLTIPELSTERSLEGKSRREEGEQRALRSIGSRYVLKADFARFYPSIYTHSIGWAVHGKAKARAPKSNKLIGNRLDLWVRETQDKQTGGIPIGPDTSYLIAEVIASRIDADLARKLKGQLRGTRYIDDYHLYFATLSEAEKALSALHRISRTFEIDINDLKTQIIELPEPIEPFWKTQLRQIDIRVDDFATSLKAIFDRAAELAKDFPQDSVFTYLARKIEKTKINATHWEICESLLLRGTIGEPGILPVLMRIFESNGAGPSVPLRQAIESLCLHHSSLQQSSEVAWALWFAKSHSLILSQAVADAVSQVDDDIVALVTLDLHNNHLLPEPRGSFLLWRKYMKAEHLYSEHWLLAYEALEQNWLASEDGTDYIANDSFFSILKQHGVRFYDPSSTDLPSIFGYNDGDDSEADDEQELLETSHFSDLLLLKAGASNEVPDGSGEEPDVEGSDAPA
jgi:hypothetical protein